MKSSGTTKNIRTLAKIAILSLLLPIALAAPIALVVQHALVEPASALEPGAALERLRGILSLRHLEKTPQEIAAMLGGEDILVQALISLRADNSVPFISVRAEKMLVTAFAGRPDALAVLREDLSPAGSPAFARTIVANLDSIQNAEARAELGRLGLARAFADASFVPYARMLSFSSDPVLRDLGAQLPQVAQ